MQKFISATFLLAATIVAGDGYAQQTPATSPATTPSASTQKSTSAKKTTSAAKAPAPLTTEKEKFSYALGMNIGSGYSQGLKKQNVEVDWNLLVQGLKDAATGTKTRLTEDEAKTVLTAVNERVVKQQQEKLKEDAAKNKTEGDAFLASNKTKEGVVTLPSGLEYKILTAGTGPKPTATDSVVCNYRGTFVNGTEFDSSYKRGQPATFGVNQVIKGWTEALQLMPVGSKWQLFIPSNLAYGERGEPRGGIEPNETLIFDVELMSIVDKNKKEGQSTAPEKKDDKGEAKN
jgi:FKBP-type peptidyl-prolyl cis-trans isomerase FklB